MWIDSLFQLQNLNKTAINRNMPAGYLIGGNKAIFAELSGDENGRLGIGFHFYLPTSVLNDSSAYIEFSYQQGAHTEQITVADSIKKSNGKRLFFCRLPAKNLRDIVTAKLYNSDGTPIQIISLMGDDLTETGVCYSAFDYYDYRLAVSSNRAEIDYINAVKNFGTAVQIHLKYNATGLVVDDVSWVTQEMLEEYKGITTGTLPEGITKTSYTLNFDKNGVIFVFAMWYNDIETRSDYKYYIDGEIAPLYYATGRDETNLYQLYANPIKYDERHIFSLGETEPIRFSSYCALTYARAILISGNEAGKNAGRTMYVLWLAAKKWLKK